MKLKKTLKNQKGSALLVSLLVMGVLIAISLALSTLIIREIRLTKGVLDAGRAYYAAESGIEVALYEVNNSLPGWETPNKGYQPLKLDEDFASVAEFRVDNTCNAYPCLDEEFDKTSIGTDLQVFYDVLELNESINIPLFVVEDGKEVPVGNFTVEFFAGFNPLVHFNEDVKRQLAGQIQGWDILRWKIFGITEQNVTESISDFTALSSYNQAGEDGNDETVFTNAGRPSWFGSISCSEVPRDAERESPAIECVRYDRPIPDITVDETTGEVIYPTCNVDQAREHYIYDQQGKVISVTPCYSIQTFLSEHDLNYLTLTNLMNPAVFDGALGQARKMELSKLYFRVELFADKSRPDTGNKTVREFANITSNGYSGDSKQSINVKMQRGSFMPVFHFSLYSTSGASAPEEEANEREVEGDEPPTLRRGE